MENFSNSICILIRQFRIVRNNVQNNTIDNTKGSEGALKKNSLCCNLVSSLNGRVRPLVFLLAPIEPSRINRLSKSIKRSHEFVLIYTHAYTSPWYWPVSATKNASFTLMCAFLIPKTYTPCKLRERLEIVIWTRALGKGCLSRAQPKAGLVTQSTFYRNRFQIARSII